MIDLPEPTIDPEFEVLDFDAVCEQCNKDFISHVWPVQPMCLDCAKKHWDSGS